MSKKIKITEKELNNIIKESIAKILNEQKLTSEPDLNDFSQFNLTIEDYREMYVDLRYIPTPILDNGNPLYEEYTLKTPIFEIKDPFDVVKEIVKKYSLNPHSMNAFEAENKIYIIMVLAQLGVNDELIKNDMEKLGYFLSKKGGMRKIDDMDYQILQFEPTSQIQNDETETILKECPFLYHWTPTYLVDSIMSNGLILSHRNYKFKYPARTYLMRSNCSKNAIINLGNQLCFSNKDERNDGNYTLIMVSLNNLDDNIRFYYDPNSAIGIYTEQPIPPSNLKQLGTTNFISELMSEK